MLAIGSAHHHAYSTCMSILKGKANECMVIVLILILSGIGCRWTDIVHAQLKIFTLHCG